MKKPLTRDEDSLLQRQVVQQIVSDAVARGYVVSVVDPEYADGMIPAFESNAVEGDGCDVSVFRASCADEVLAELTWAERSSDAKWATAMDQVTLVFERGGEVARVDLDFAFQAYDIVVGYWSNQRVRNRAHGRSFRAPFDPALAGVRKLCGKLRARHEPEPALAHLGVLFLSPSIF